MIRSREIAGWLMLMAGLGVFAFALFGLLLRGKFVESGPAIMIGFVVYRGGVHLLKVALAAKMLQEPVLPKRVKV
jgi:hypothetical protein